LRFTSNCVLYKKCDYETGSIPSCTATSSLFELKQGEEVTVAGPVSGTIYQAIKAGETPATATVYYLTENGQPGNVTKPFVFTIS